ncbi:MAG: LysM domain-containing protein [Dehalococcoidia bacterium]|nr:LysM domain-containing protein [Dehalococcoidia bacterium]
MSARAVPLYLFALTVALAVFAACGGGDDGVRPTGRLTDPRTVATATPWAEAPEPIILEPGALTPISDGGDGGGEGTPTPSGECGDTYKVLAGDVPFTIAEKCGVTVEDLLKANPEVTPTALRVGQELKIP